MAWDNHRAARSDDVKECLNYSTVAEAILMHLHSHCFALIERVAEEVADLLMSSFNTPGVRIKVAKLGAVLQASQVGVLIKRGLIPD
ncbi:Dihydroneopterin aldolase [Pantoea sp. Nvir]|nr:Dihydroneopterin aldolase [Pantoea sp. Nvir]